MVLCDGGGLAVADAEQFTLLAGLQVQVTSPIHGVNAGRGQHHRRHVHTTAVADGEVGRTRAALAVVGEQVHGLGAAARWGFGCEGACGRVKTDPAGQGVAVRIAGPQAKGVAVAIGESTCRNDPGVFGGARNRLVRDVYPWVGFDRRVVGIEHRELEDAGGAATAARVGVELDPVRTWCRTGRRVATESAGRRGERQPARQSSAVGQSGGVACDGITRLLCEGVGRKGERPGACTIESHPRAVDRHAIAVVAVGLLLDRIGDRWLGDRILESDAECVTHRPAGTGAVVGATDLHIDV